MHILAEAGIKIVHTESWWNDTVNNPLDIYYNETFRTYAKGVLNFSLGLTGETAVIDTDDLWAVTLGDEEPAWIHYVDIFSSLSPEIAKYSDIYYAETGYQLKPIYDTNLTECGVFVEWLNEKSVWVYNYMHDYVKSLMPHVLVFQPVMMHPVWGLPYELCAPYELKADGYGTGCYYAVQDPWLLYDTTRRYKTSMPESEFHMTIWGTIWDFVNEAGDGLYYKEGSYEQMRRETWISYLSGADVLTWFDWGPQDNNSYTWRWGHERTDIMGRRNWKYVDNLAGQLEKLPVLKSEPEVLVIGTGYQTGAPMQSIAEVGLFTECDLVNQRCFAKADIDLSNYSLVMVTDGWYYDETVRKLNAFVEEGGNVMFLGGIRSGEGPEDETEAFQIERNSTEPWWWVEGHFRINVTKPNILDLELYQEAPLHATHTIQAENLSSDYHPISGFYQVDENGTPVEINDYPLLLYHNESSPDSGWVMYFGAVHSSTDLGATWETYDREKQPDLWYLYREVVKAFAKFLGITNSISANETEDMLITQGVIEDGTIIAGIHNFRNESRNLTYKLDLSQFGFPAGNYWVHSLDENRLEGQYETNGQILSFGTHVVANGTRLFLISEDRPEPDYSIQIFPHIPSIADVTPTTTTTTPATSTQTPATTADDIFGVYIIVGGTVIGLSVFTIVIVMKKRAKQQPP